MKWWRHLSRCREPDKIERQRHRRGGRGRTPSTIHCSKSNFRRRQADGHSTSCAWELLWAPAQRKRATMLYFANVFLFFFIFFMAALFSGPGERRFAKVLHVVDLESTSTSTFILLTSRSTIIVSMNTNRIWPSNGWLKKGKIPVNIANQFTENMFTNKSAQ